MSFKGFTPEDFQVFTINGLEARMTAIREQLQPKFRQLGEQLTVDLSSLIGDEMFLHIAKHARRTVNPPKDTWLAIGPNKRGYKKYPHFQVGLFDDYLFIWLAYIYELPNKEQIAERLIQNVSKIEKMVPNDFVVSTNHMKKNAQPIRTISIEETLTRFKNVKKAEFLIGRNIVKDDPILTDGEKLQNLIFETFKTLVPVYKISLAYGNGN